MHLGNLANVLHVRGSFDGALAKYEEALAIAEKRLGADHPTSLILRSNLVGVLVFLERWPEAEAQAREVVAAQERTLGPEHADLGFSLVGLGSAIEHRDAAAALPHYHRAIALMEKAFGTESIDLVPALTNLASAELSLGRPAEARVQLERARQIQERTYDAPHVDRVFVLASLARVARYERRIDDAVALAEQCVQQAEDAGAPGHVVAGTARSEAGAALIAGGRAAEAIVWLEAAASLVEAATGQGLELAIVRVRLADAYANDGREDAARELLRDVERMASSAGGRGSALLAHVALVEALLDRAANERLRARISALDPPERERAQALLLSR
jgi:tetratricopeptide (TPR) repeat protein